MKNLLKTMGIIALAAVIGLGMMACGDGGGGGSGKYSGKDVLGNKYSLSVGSDARAASRGDRFNIVVDTRGGKKNINGTVTERRGDGTLTLKQDGTNNTFTAIPDGRGNLKTVYSNNHEQSGFAPRTFDTVYLRANRWGNPTNDNVYGEGWGSGDVVLVKDFPANVSGFEVNAGNRYKLTVSGVSDTKLDNFRVDIHGLTAKNEWVWLGKTTMNQNMAIKAGEPFEKTVFLDGMNDFSATSAKFMDYKEIIMQVSNVIKHIEKDSVARSEDYGSIPSNVQNWDIMATISDFNIVLKDTDKQDLNGNMGNYTFGIKADGISPEYRMVMWKLSAENLARAKEAGAKLKLTFWGGNNIETKGAALAFIWQDPVRELWWQDEKQFFAKAPPAYTTIELPAGATWNSATGEIELTLSSFVGAQFADATEVNILIMCNYWDGSATSFSIDELKITGASIN